MTLSEFNNEFDVLFNNVMSNRAPGLDEYEKSVFLTRAQEDIVKGYFTNILNKEQKGFDETERRQSDFSTLIKTYAPPIVPGVSNVDSRSNGVASVTMPDDVMMIVNEYVNVQRKRNTIILQVLPLSHMQYTSYMISPYKRPSRWIAWRIQTNNGNNTVADLIVGPNDSITNYTMRYVKKPKPIILEPLEGLTIDGYAGCDSSYNLVTSNAVYGSECEMNEIVHREILLRAVELAKAAYMGDLQTQIVLGQNSATPLGVVSNNQSKEQ